MYSLPGQCDGYEAGSHTGCLSLLLSNYKRSKKTFFIPYEILNNRASYRLRRNVYLAADFNNLYMKLLKTLVLFVTLFSLFAMDANSQNSIKKYEASWKKVEDFVKKNLPQSALAEVKKIYQLAKKGRNRMPR